jgi:hypothetical protein
VTPDDAAIDPATQITLRRGVEGVLPLLLATSRCLEVLTAETALIRDLATDTTKGELFDRLHEHFNRLDDQVEQAMKSTMK